MLYDNPNFSLTLIETASPRLKFRFCTVSMRCETSVPSPSASVQQWFQQSRAECAIADQADPPAGLPHPLTLPGAIPQETMEVRPGVPGTADPDAATEGAKGKAHCTKPLLVIEGREGVDTLPMYLRIICAMCVGNSCRELRSIAR